MTRSSFASLACVTLVGSLSVGCQGQADEADEFRHAVPRKETVEMAVPGGNGQALTEEGQARPILGQTAEFYKLTRAVTTMINGAGGAILVFVKTVTNYPPSNITENIATWGPWTEDLSPNTWRVTVEKVSAISYRYKFEGKAKTADDSAYVTVLSGNHTPALDGSGQPIEGFGRGDFVLDWDAAAMLPEHKPEEMGRILYTYSRMGSSDVTDIKAAFRQVRDEDTGERIDANYAYLQAPGGGGSMVFTHKAPQGMNAAPPRWAVKSRWTAHGAGRADVRGVDGTSQFVGQASECWNENFASTFMQVNWDPNGGYGNEATDCVFQTPEYSAN